MREGTDEAHYGCRFEINYNLRMRVGAECGGSPWLRMREDIYNLAAREKSFIEYKLEFLIEISRQGYIRL